MTKHAAVTGALAITLTWLVPTVASLRSDLAAAKRDAWEAQVAAAAARSEAQRMTVAATEIGARLDDVERLAMELQDGVPPEAYRNGFPGAEDEWMSRPRRHCAGKTCAADAGARR